MKSVVLYLFGALFLVTTACSKSGAEEQLKPKEELATGTTWQAYQALDLKDKLEFAKWVADTIYYEEFKQYPQMSGWANTGTYTSKINPGMEHIYFEDFVAYSCADSAFFSFFYNLDNNSVITPNLDQVDYYISLGDLGDSLTANLSLQNDTVLVLKAYGSSSFRSEKTAGGEPHYEKQNYTFVYSLFTNGISMP